MGVSKADRVGLLEETLNEVNVWLNKRMINYYVDFISAGVKPEVRLILNRESWEAYNERGVLSGISKQAKVINEGENSVVLGTIVQPPSDQNPEKNLALFIRIDSKSRAKRLDLLPS